MPWIFSQNYLFAYPFFEGHFDVLSISSQESDKGMIISYQILTLFSSWKGRVKWHSDGKISFLREKWEEGKWRRYGFFHIQWICSSFELLYKLLWLLRGGVMYIHDKKRCRLFNLFWRFMYRYRQTSFAFTTWGFFSHHMLLNLIYFSIVV